MDGDNFICYALLFLSVAIDVGTVFALIVLAFKMRHVMKRK